MGDYYWPPQLYDFGKGWGGSHPIDGVDGTWQDDSRISTNYNGIYTVPDSLGADGDVIEYYISVHAVAGEGLKFAIDEFVIEDTLSNNAYLSDLTIDGTTIAGFNSDTLSYEIELPEGTTDIPIVGATASNRKATVEITQASTLPSSATVIVTAEDGVTKLTYTVYFTVGAPTAISAPSTDMSVSIYPNPVTNGVIYISFDSTVNDEVVVSIISSAGKIVYSDKIQSISGKYIINGLDNLEKGIYLLNVYFKDQRKVYKIVF
jgi:hypothetical protein